MVKKKSDGKTLYDRSSRATRIVASLAEKGRIHIPWRKAIFEESSHGRLKYYSSPVMEGSVLPDWKVFLNEVKDLGGKHTHQGGGVIIFILEGEGYSICDGDRVDWEPEDLILLPIKPGGVVHQHFNKNPDKYCRWVAFRFEPFHIVLGDRVEQNEPRPGWELPKWSKKPILSHLTEGLAMEGTTLPEIKEFRSKSLYGDLIQMRDKQREEIKSYINLVKGRDLAWEYNPQGKMRWYLHPSLTDRIQTFLFYVQEIPPGSKTGKQKHQGGKVIFILEGRGHSEIGKRTIKWGKYDYLGLPRVREGIVFQHFNDNPDEPAKLIVVEPNFYPILGVDMGGGFEQLEFAPEFRD